MPHLAPVKHPLAFSPLLCALALAPLFGCPGGGGEGDTDAGSSLPAGDAGQGDSADGGPSAPAPDAGPGTVDAGPGAPAADAGPGTPTPDAGAPSVDAGPGTLTPDAGAPSVDAGTGTSTPCDGLTPIASGAPFTIDFGDAGVAAFDGTTAVCQMSAAPNGRWLNADGNSGLYFNGLPATPGAIIDQGSVINVLQLKWIRAQASGGDSVSNDFVGTATATVLTPGPYFLGTAADPLTLCLHDVSVMENGSGETATFPGPIALGCN